MHTFSDFLTENWKQDFTPVEHECFRNVNNWNARYGEPGDIITHGEVTNVQGKRFKHAWVERGDVVIDPTTKVELPKEKYYRLLRAHADDRYTSTEALRNQMRTGHHGPWT